MVQSQPPGTLKFESKQHAGIQLSICITTFKRGPFIGETLDSILPQIGDGVELLVVDGASPDGTPRVMAEYVAKNPGIRYFREKENSGIDGDYDKAVKYALGKYCWLMTDDDLLHEGAIATVLKVLEEDPDLVVVNSELKTVDMSMVLADNMLDLAGQEKYEPREAERAFVDVAKYMSFIGGVVIKRSVWLDRDRTTYYGSLFIHVGVVFQRPVGLVRVIRQPLIAIRYGNAMWTPRGFEIWMFKWPSLIWSFANYSPEAKAGICLQEPWKVKKKVLLYRALGGYGREEFRRFIAPKVRGFTRLAYATIAVLPPALMNSLASIYCAFINRKARSDLYDLSRSRHATWLSRTLARTL
ncbi:MAG: glycosyltransferase family 2 protein [Nitrospiraceae bacterium]